MSIRTALTTLALGLGMAGGAAGQTLADADAHFQARRWDDAERVYRSILGRDSTDVMAWYRLGRIALEGRADAPAAVLHFEAALRHGFMPPYIVQFGIARARTVQGRAEDALGVLEQLAGGGFGQPGAVTGDSILATLSSRAKYAEVVARMQRNAEPCEHAPEARQFDFWIGTWDVVTPGGQPLGTNRIEKLLRGCVLQENWTGGGGREGKSMNYFDPQQRTWRQLWVSDAASVLDYSAGEFRDRAMRFTGITMTPAGDTVQQKLTFHSIHADTVRQVFEQSTDRGRTWAMTWEGIYIRRKD